MNRDVRLPVRRERDTCSSDDSCFLLSVQQWSQCLDVDAICLNDSLFLCLRGDSTRKASEILPPQSTLCTFILCPARLGVQSSHFQIPVWTLSPPSPKLTRPNPECSHRLRLFRATRGGAGICDVSIKLAYVPIPDIMKIIT